MALGALKAHFHCKPDSKPYQAPLRCVANMLQKLFKDELDQLQNLT